MALNIKAAIALRGKTMAWVANKMGVKLPTLSEMVSGNPTVDTLERIAAALHCDVAELFDRPVAWQERRSR
jgi:transcriptional regulator with XRE-family HTH domain